MIKQTDTARLAHVLNAASFDIWLEQADPFGQQICCFDLSDFRLITPSATVQLAALCHALHRDGHRPVIALYNNPSLKSYLRRAGFMTAVEPVVRFRPAFYQALLRCYDDLRGSNPVLIEVTRIESTSMLPDLLDKIAAVLQEKLNYQEYDAFDVTIAVSEICQNVVDHNHQTYGFLAMQFYQPCGSGGFLEIGLADYGQGIMSSLSRNLNNPLIASDLDAIRFATKQGTSEYDDQTRGTGLYHLIEIAYKHRGSVDIRSGVAKIAYRYYKRDGHGITVAWMPGVQISLMLPAHRQTFGDKPKHAGIASQNAVRRRLKHSVVQAISGRSRQK